MSAPFRNQILLILPEAQAIIDENQEFPVPARDQNQPLSIYITQLETLISNLDIHLTNCTEVSTDLSSAHDRWTSLRTNMTGAERTADNDLYNQFIQHNPYHNQMMGVKSYVRSLRKQKQTLKNALVDAQNALPPPPPPQAAAPYPNPTFAHLPRMLLPTFDGNCSEFPSFLNQFSAAVGDMPNLANSIKLSYLKSCLKGPSLSLVSSLPLTDDSYQTALDLLNNKFNDPNEISRSLHQSLKKLPHVRTGENFCPDLSKLIDMLEGICIRFEQQGNSPNSIHIQLEVEGKLPVFVLEEIFKAKEGKNNWSAEDLRTKLKTILKRKQEIGAIHPFHQSVKPNKSSHVPPPSLSSSHHFQAPPGPNPNSSLTFYTQSSQPNKPRKPVPSLPCLFCGEPGHFSSACRKFSDVKSRSLPPCNTGPKCAMF